MMGVLDPLQERTTLNFVEDEASGQTGSTNELLAFMLDRGPDARTA